MRRCGSGVGIRRGLGHEKSDAKTTQNLAATPEFHLSPQRYGTGWPIFVAQIVEASNDTLDKLFSKESG